MIISFVEHAKQNEIPGVREERVAAVSDERRINDIITSRRRRPIYFAVFPYETFDTEITIRPRNYRRPHFTYCDDNDPSDVNKYTHTYIYIYALLKCVADTVLITPRGGFIFTRRYYSGKYARRKPIAADFLGDVFYTTRHWPVKVFLQAGY